MLFLNYFLSCCFYIELALKSKEFCFRIAAVLDSDAGHNSRGNRHAFHVLMDLNLIIEAGF